MDERYKNITEKFEHKVIRHMVADNNKTRVVASFQYINMLGKINREDESVNHKKKNHGPFSCKFRISKIFQLVVAFGREF